MNKRHMDRSGRGQGYHRGGAGGRGSSQFRGRGGSWERGGNFGRRGGFDQRFQNPHQNQYGNRYGNPKAQWQNKPRDTPGKRLTEAQIGVTAYFSDHEGFNGVIKSRYSDFQVSEISEDGEIAKLTDLTAPVSSTDNDDYKEDEDVLLSKYNLELLPMEVWDKINKLATYTEPTDEVVEVDVTGMSKEQRTKIHDSVKRAFGDAIVGSTVTQDDKKLVKFVKYRAGVRIDTRVKWLWPGQYVRFVVYKENCDTLEAASLIAERLKITLNPSILGYAGTKDRRAKTSQWFTVRRIEPARLAAACRSLRDIAAGNYTFCPKVLKLGALKGNRFRIALRNVTAVEEVVVSACERLRDVGFINYYGLQRFGTRAQTPTYEIGLKLLQGKYKEAINAILEEREGPMQTALSVYKRTGDAAAACASMRKYNLKTSVEGKVLKALAMAPNDYIGALNKVPRNVRLLYMHAYQSLIWNRCVSERLRRAGRRPSVGDLVLLQDAHCPLQEEDIEDESEEEEDEENMKQEKEEDQETNSEVATNETESEKKSECTKKKDVDLKPRIPVKVLTEEDIANGKYTLHDIILPLPGYRVEYPTNVKDFYQELIGEDKLEIELKHKLKSFNMGGAYRHMVVRPTEFEWSFVRYTNPYGDLILSDLDELNNKKITSIIPDGKFTALLLTMSLPSSCYATMALRELLKVDTSGDFQASQNDYHVDKKKDNTEGAKEAVKRKHEREEEGDVKKLRSETDRSREKVNEKNMDDDSDEKCDDDSQEGFDDSEEQ